MNILNLMKKKKTITIISSTLVVLIAAGSILTIHANAATRVDSYTVVKGDIEQMLELNGKIEASESKTFFADADLKVKEIHVKAGDMVKKGDLLVSFDDDDIERQLALLECDIQAKEGGYNNAIQTSNKYSAMYSQASRDLNYYNQQINETEAAIIAKQKEISDRSSKLANEGAKLQVQLVEDTPGSAEYNNHSKLAANNSYIQSYDEELLRLQRELQQLELHLADLKENKAAAVSEKASSQTGILTEGAKSQLEANKKANEITDSDRKAKIEGAKNGIVATFDGVVTEINVSEGAVAMTGSSIIKVDSLDNVVVRCDANKYDIIGIEEGQDAKVKILNTEYTGSVKRVEKMLGSNNGSVGVGVEISIDDAKDVILGYEVKAYINTASINDTLTVPRDAIVSEDDGDYVYVSKDKKAVKTKVVTGVKNDDQAEIVSGINDGEVIVWSDAKELKDGEDVRY